MSYSLIFTDSYKKRAKRFAKKHPELAGQYRKVLYLLKENPQHPLITSAFVKRTITKCAFRVYQYELSNYAGIIDYRKRDYPD